MNADTRLEELDVSGLGEVDEPAIVTFHDDQFPLLALPERLPADGTE
jgi:hypothetical protein